MGLHYYTNVPLETCQISAKIPWVGTLYVQVPLFFVVNSPSSFEIPEVQKQNIAWGNCLTGLACQQYLLNSRNVLNKTRK